MLLPLDGVLELPLRCFDIRKCWKKRYKGKKLPLRFDDDQELLDIFTNYRPVKKWQVDNVEIDMGLGWVGGDYGLWIKDISFVFGLKFNLRC